MCNLVEFDLWLFGEIELPRCLLIHEKLVVLKLRRELSLTFPSLRVLHLDYLRYLDEASIQKLISGSPALQELVVRKDYDDDDVRILHVCSSSLKSLTIYVTTDPLYREDYYRVDVDAPNLEFLELADGLSEEFNVIPFSSLAKAEVHVGFQNHLKEEFDVYMNRIVQILRRIPNVKVLFLFQRMLKCSDEWIWRAPQFVPRCLLLCLEVMKFWSSEWKSAEFEMTEYFLKNAMVLKKIEIESHIVVSKDIGDKLLMFPKGSSSCQIAFS